MRNTEHGTRNRCSALLDLLSCKTELLLQSEMNMTDSDIPPGVGVTNSEVNHAPGSAHPTSGQVTYEIVERVANRMYAIGQPVKVREVQRLTGGGTSQITEFVAEWRRRLNEQNLLLAKELGANSDFIRVLAEQINQIVARTSHAEQMIIADLQAQNADFQTVIKELEDERISAEDLSAGKDSLVKDAQKLAKDASLQSQSAIKEMEQILATEKAELQAETKALVESAQRESNQKQTIIDSLNNDKELLQRANTDLAVDEAKRELQKQSAEDARQNLVAEQEERAGIETKLAVAEEQLKALPTLQKRYEALEAKFDALADSSATTNANNVGLQTSKDSLSRENDRLAGQIEKLSSRVTEQERISAVETDKAVGLSQRLVQLEKDLQISERERSSLGQGLSAATSSHAAEAEKADSLSHRVMQLEKELAAATTASSKTKTSQPKQ